MQQFSTFYRMGRTIKTDCQLSLIMPAIMYCSSWWWPETLFFFHIIFRGNDIIKMASRGHPRGSNTCLYLVVILQLAISVKGDTNVLSCRVNAGKEPIWRRPFDSSPELAFSPLRLEKQSRAGNNEDEFVQFPLGWFWPTDPTES